VKVNGTPSELRVLSVGDVAPSPPPLRSESEIRSTWIGSKPLVSVTCATFNHREFIETALLGFLGQSTTFPFEILVRDDASSDGTPEIIRDFEARYPSLIRGLYEKENLYPGIKPFFVFKRQALGRYVATCEGDDYWIDPNKLQIQFESLESRADMSLSFHAFVTIENGVVTRVPATKPQRNREFTANQVKRGQAASRSLTRFLRNIPMEPTVWSEKIFNHDSFVESRMGELGGAVCESSLFAGVYRVHPGGVFSGLDTDEQAIRLAASFFYIAKYHLANGDVDAAKAWRDKGLGKYSRLTAESFIFLKDFRGVRLFVDEIKRLLFQRVARVKSRSFNPLFSGVQGTIRNTYRRLFSSK
jgi:glycosyltransferase involved in cell wall biosynthesis